MIFAVQQLLIVLGRIRICATYDNLQRGFESEPAVVPRVPKAIDASSLLLLLQQVMRGRAVSFFLSLSLSRSLAPLITHDDADVSI